ncbi:MAG: M4 family metallopeptidase [Deltaproteobacteria bacterium]|nr:M4 family metallopeptidase [Deltaproteobacteria bacterium]
MNYIIRHRFGLALLAGLIASSSYGAERIRTDLDGSAFISPVAAESPSLRSLIGAESSTALIRGQKIPAGEEGASVSRYRQSYLGWPVWGVSLGVKATSHDTVESVSGSWLKGIEDDIQPDDLNHVISADAALSAALGDGMSPGFAAPAPDAASVVAKNMIWQDQDGRARLVWQLSWFQDHEGSPSRPYRIVDALSGQILDRWEGLAHRDAVGPGGNKKTGRYYFGQDYGALEVSDDCRMVTSSGGEVLVRTIDMNHKTSGGQVHQFDCPENNVRAVNGAYAPMNDAHYFGSLVFKLYRDWYQTRPIVQPLVLRVHYGRGYENAFWDGSQMTFGDGESRFYPLVGLDIIAHEVSHGFTEQNSGLAYRDQSGGLNEFFSDAAGETAKFYLNGDNDFLVGASVFKSSQGALRYMQDPSRDGFSAGHISEYRDGMDVHFSSGIFNKAFYHLATTDGWDTRKAFDIFVRANQIYWNENTDFQEGACGAWKAAKDLEYNTNDVRAAFQKVGIVTCSDEPGEPPPDIPAPDGGDDGDLGNGIPLENLHGKEGEESFFVMKVLPGQSHLQISLSGGEGDADLYVRFGEEPSAQVFNCRPWKSGNEESCSFDYPSSGDWHIMIRGYNDYSGLTLTGSYN